MKLFRKKTTFGELASNVSTLAQYKLGIKKPEKKNKTTTILAITAGAITAVTAGVAGLLYKGKTKNNPTEKPEVNVSNPPEKAPEKEKSE